MKIEDLEIKNPKFKEFTKNIPKTVRENYFIKRFKRGEIISQKQDRLENFGILVLGQARVINELENGNIYMIEANPAIDYIGEVTILSKQEKTSVTIEALTDSIVFFVPRKHAEEWIFSDLELLGRISERVAYKLYRSSIESGKKLYYSSDFIFVDYLVKKGRELEVEQEGEVKLLATRMVLAEEIGMNIKTLNRMILKLKNRNFFRVEKGKILLTRETHNQAVNYLDISKMK